MLDIDRVEYPLYPSQKIGVRGVSVSLIEKLLEELRSREDLRDALAEELAISIVRSRRVRLAIANAILREVATKQDIAELRNYIDQRIDNLRKEMKEEIDKLRQEMKEEIESLRKEMKEEDEALRHEMKRGDDSLRQEIEKLRKEMKESDEVLRNEIEKLRKEMKEEIDSVRKELNDLGQRVARLETTMNLFVKIFIAFNLPILLGIIGILLRMVYSP